MNEISDMDKSHVTDKNIYDYLKFCKETSVCYKLAGLITSKQLVINVARGDLDDHWGMITSVCQKVFPERNYDFNYLYGEAIELYSVGYDFQVNLPDRISYQQYLMLLDVLEQIKRFEDNYGKIEYFDVEHVMEEAEKKLSINYLFEKDEVIVGNPIKEEMLADSIVGDVRLEKCGDVNDVMDSVRQMVNYYNDEFFKSVLIKMCPSIEEVKKLYDEIICLPLSFDNDFVVKDVSFENIKHILKEYYNLNKKSEFISDDETDFIRKK